MLDQILATWRALPLAPWAVGAGLVAAVVSTRFSPGRSRRDRVGVAFLVLWGVVAAGTATTPVGGVWQPGPLRGCTLDHWVPLSPLRWLETSSDALNVWFCVPAGVAATLLDGRRRLVALGLVVLTPLGCEAAQLLLVAAGRVCTSQDVANNWVGTLVGVGLGGAAAAAAQWSSPRSRRRRS